MSKSYIYNNKLSNNKSKESEYKKVNIKDSY